MKRSFLSIAVLILASAPVHSQQTAAKQVSPTGRYQLFSAVCDPLTSSDQREQCVFLLDTQTGKVWKYQGAANIKDANGKPQYLNPTFIPVGIGLPTTSPIVP